MLTRDSAAAMPLFRTPVELDAPLRPFDVAHRVVCLGSCFAQHMGANFVDARIDATVNPLGALFNPASIVRVALSPQAEEVAEGPMGWHTWLSGTALTAPTREEALERANASLGQLRQALLRADHLVLTLGTTHVYRHLASDAFVANCHKHPAREFQEEELALEQVVGELSQLMDWLAIYNKECMLTLTVSPYRYAKYGFHASQLSKATLLLAIRELERRYPGRVQYFPAYEIILDELRDYRFFEADMLHPSAQAVDYVWLRLAQWMTPRLRDYLGRIAPFQALLRHRSADPAHQERIAQALAQWETVKMEMMKDKTNH